MNTEIKIIEDLSLNAWPSYQMQMYDGWILRYSSFYTYRTNCVDQIGASYLPIPEKVNYCERVYRRWQTPAIFKISPLSDPELEDELLTRQYQIRHETDVMTRDLSDLSYTPLTNLKITNRVTYQWLEGLFQLKDTENIVHRRMVPAMYDAIPKDEIAVLLIDGETVVATGLGILDRDYVGVYAIHVGEAYRRRHYAQDIVNTILTEGRKHGAKKAYLQVVSDNEPARELYRKLGFSKSYSYRFYLKEEI